jgi:DNA uptake protein ComE-like DNA-binding protein
MTRAFRIIVLLLAVLAMPTAAHAQAKKAKPAAADKAAKPAAAEPIDLNTATEDQLKSIKGIGDVYAKKIIDNRPYDKKDQLVSKKVLPKGVYAKVKDQVIAKQAK